MPLDPALAGRKAIPRSLACGRCGQRLAETRLQNPGEPLSKRLWASLAQCLRRTHAPRLAQGDGGQRWAARRHPFTRPLRRALSTAVHGRRQPRHRPQGSCAGPLASLHPTGENTDVAFQRNYQQVSPLTRLSRFLPRDQGPDPAVRILPWLRCNGAGHLGHDAALLGERLRRSKGGARSADSPAGVLIGLWRCKAVFKADVWAQAGRAPGYFRTRRREKLSDEARANRWTAPGRAGGADYGGQR